MKVLFGVYIGILNLDMFLFLGSIGIDYSYYLIGWIIGVVVIGCIFLLIYVVFFY